MTSTLAITDQPAHFDHPPAPEEPADDDSPVRQSMPIRWHWLGLWLGLTAFAAFEVGKHGFVDGTTSTAAILLVAAITAFVAPDLTFVVGIGQPVEKGHLPLRAVRWYNAMHRMWVPLSATFVIGVALAPLGYPALVAFVAGLSWMAHIALDRAAGYGLRNTDGSRGDG